MNDQKNKRRSVDAIAHLFLSCQDESDATTECTLCAVPPDPARQPSGMRIVASDPDECETSPALSQAREVEFMSIEPRVLATGPIGHPAGRGEGLESRGSIQLVVDPCVYPVAKLVWAEATSQDGVFEATIPLHRETWVDVANYCKKQAEQLEVLGSDESANTWNRVAEFIMSEIAAAERRQKNREVYGYFADFVAAIGARTDIDKARKAQMIHDKACQLKLD